MAIEFKATAKFFTNEGKTTKMVHVDGDEVRVFSSIEGYYTTCHALSASAVKRILRIAKN